MWRVRRSDSVPESRSDSETSVHSPKGIHGAKAKVGLWNVPRGNRRNKLVRLGWRLAATTAQRRRLRDCFGCRRYTTVMFFLDELDGHRAEDRSEDRSMVGVKSIKRLSQRSLGPPFACRL